MPFTIPNILTWGRIALIPVFIGIFYLADYLPTGMSPDLTATLIFIFAAVTDWFDGYLARYLQQTSAFGAFLDPVADKLMVAAALIVLVDLNRVDVLVAVVIIGREIAISALREWMAILGKSANTAVATIGKLKTAAQMVAIPLLLYQAPLFSFDTQQIGTILIILATLLTLWSMFYYLRCAWPQLRNIEEERATWQK